MARSPRVGLSLTRLARFFKRFSPLEESRAMLTYTDVPRNPLLPRDSLHNVCTLNYD